MDTILTLVNKGNDFLWSFLLILLCERVSITFVQIYPGKKPEAASMCLDISA